ncbi:hypothetical protein GMMP13_220018 [Candidatus Magnetomoraceae bacterium gMMP-13]
MDALIYSHEDRRLNYVGSPIFEKNHDFYIGKVGKRFDILILRDPFNLFAGRLHSKRMRVYANTLSVADMWIMYAREYLGMTNYLKNNKTLVNYNQWCIDRSYREKLAKKLELEFSDEGFEEVSKIGFGSSFDGTRYQNKASNMKVFERWKNMINNDEYIKMFNDKIIIDLSDKIFGTPKDIETFINNQLLSNFSSWAPVRRKLMDVISFPTALILYLRFFLGLTRN